MDAIASTSIRESIQLAITPVFLLVAIGSLLNVMTQRLARVIDRARVLEEIVREDAEGSYKDRCQKELSELDKRIIYSNRAISASAVAALLISFQVAVLFLGELFAFEFSRAVAMLFVLSMASIIYALYAFWTEIRIATRMVRIGR